MKQLERELSGDLFLSIKKDNGTRVIPNHCFQYEIVAKVTQKFKNNGLIKKAPEIIRSSLKLSFSDE